MKNVIFLALGIAGLGSAISVPDSKEEPEIHGKKIDISDSMIFDVICITSDASPLLHHIYEAADKINTDIGTHCFQSHSSGDHCTAIEASVGAKIRICNHGENTSGIDASITCKLVQDMARKLADNCSNNKEGEERAGGEIVKWMGGTNGLGWQEDPNWVDVVTME